MLWSIEGLSPRFIYFNDDFVLTKPCKPEHFFQDHTLVLRGKWKRIFKYGKVRQVINQFVSFLAKSVLGITRSMHHLLQIRSAQLRSEEHTSELQSRGHLVCRLLLE